MPTACLACGSQNVARHCRSERTCNWSRCRTCEAVSGFVSGQPRWYVIPAGRR